jgi:hypothetical protein
LGVSIEDLDLAGCRCLVKSKGAQCKVRRRGQVREDFVLETVNRGEGARRTDPTGPTPLPERAPTCCYLRVRVKLRLVSRYFWPAGST